MSFKYGNGMVTDGLIFYLDAANPRSFVSGSTSWYDMTRNSNNGTLTNGPTYDSSNGGAVVFDGSNDYINFGNSSAVQQSSGTLSASI